MNSRCPKLLRPYSISVQIENIGEFFLCQIQNDLNNCIIVLKEKKGNRFLMFTRPSYNGKLGSFKLYYVCIRETVATKCTRKCVQKRKDFVFNLVLLDFFRRVYFITPRFFCFWWSARLLWRGTLASFPFQDLFQQFFHLPPGKKGICGGRIKATSYAIATQAPFHDISKLLTSMIHWINWVPWK